MKTAKIFELKTTITIDGDEFYTLQSARPYFIGRGGGIIERESLKKMIYRGGIPPWALRYRRYGNWYISKKYCEGLPINNAA